LVACIFNSEKLITHNSENYKNNEHFIIIN